MEFIHFAKRLLTKAAQGAIYTLQCSLQEKIARTHISCRLVFSFCWAHLASTTIWLSGMNLDVVQGQGASGCTSGLHLAVLQGKGLAAMFLACTRPCYRARGCCSQEDRCTVAISCGRMLRIAGAVCHWSLRRAVDHWCWGAGAGCWRRPDR